MPFLEADRRTHTRELTRARLGVVATVFLQISATTIGALLDGYHGAAVGALAATTVSEVGQFMVSRMGEDRSSSPVRLLRHSQGLKRTLSEISHLSRGRSQKSSDRRK